jgi:hypothetical protein
MIIPMTTTARPQQRYDHRLRDLVQRTRDVTIAADLGVPRSTARGWLAELFPRTFCTFAREFSPFQAAKVALSQALHGQLEIVG